jgi:hypothetical protein
MLCLLKCRVAPLITAHSSDLAPLEAWLFLQLLPHRVCSTLPPLAIHECFRLQSCNCFRIGSVDYLRLHSAPIAIRRLPPFATCKSSRSQSVDCYRSHSVDCYTVHIPLIATVHNPTIATVRNPFLASGWAFPSYISGDFLARTCITVRHTIINIH